MPALAGPAADEDGRTLAGLIVRESDRLDRLLIGFLDFARVRATRTALVDVGSIARATSPATGAPASRWCARRPRCRS